MMSILASNGKVDLAFLVGVGCPRVWTEDRPLPGLAVLIKARIPSGSGGGAAQQMGSDRDSGGGISPGP
jgi:hypothetical protein